MTTRPGVFSNSRVDVGGLALYESVDMQPGEKMLELGCGAGLVSLLTAQRMVQDKGTFAGEITMVDSCSRAIECSKINLEDLGYEGFTIEHTEQFDTEDKFDLVVGNPPYYANNRIAQYFIATAAKTLKEGGRLILVSKHGSVIKEMAEAVGFEVETRGRRKYDISICRW
ncbi:MAG: methyltransferase [Lentisphaeraceae bacterium]|nr:methyltransferase [Lentisphaeraceae bacterium]